MAYAALPTVARDYHDHENSRRLNSTSPSLPDFAFEDLATTLSFENQPTPPPSSNRILPTVLKSISGSQRSNHSAYSYEIVEEDDYEQSQITPKFPKRVASIMENETSSANEDTPVRTASISRHLPLHNPMPDLQSSQGAYVKNVQHLEDSAEKISLAGSIEEELQKIKIDMRRSESLSRNGQQNPAQKRRFSSNSFTNSIIGLNAAARSGGYSPAGYITSPIGSVSSQRRVSQRGARVSRQSNFSNPLPEPQLEGRPLESAMVHSPPTHAVQSRQSSESQRPPSSRGSEWEYDRPGTSNSNDTYRQAQSLFTDFDGIHFSPDGEDGHTRKISLTHPPLARDDKVYREAQPGENMVYYPAPVPVMLNLPKRLSRGDWAQQEKRRSKILSGIPTEMRKSAAWLANADEDAELEPERPNRSSTYLPPQLRASAFFDAPSTRANVKLKHASAVLTLDDILDASAYAPVNAFVDHPIAGHLGSEVYGPERGHKKKSSKPDARRRSGSLSNILSGRKSSAAMSRGRRESQILDNEVDLADDEDAEEAAKKSIAPGEDELSDAEKSEGGTDEEKEEEDSEDEQAESQHQLGFLGAPTTLLAELQMRKAEQKLRNRTAANAFPKGMHSTLLELDAVSQLQKNARKQKHIALAWEDQEAVDKANYDDEDVPLGVLFPEKDRPNHVNPNRPMGLMEKKELEENEPLAARRARLRGEPYRPPPPEHRGEPAPAINLADLDEEKEEEVEGETLAQRRKRIQEKKDAAAAAAQAQGPSLADDIAGQLGIDAEQIGGTKTPEPEEEETLGQRRKRLQAEAAQKAADALKPKIAMGDLLRAHPVGPSNMERQASAENKMALLMNRRDPSMPLVGHIQAAQPGSKALPDPTAQEPKAFHMPVPGQPLVGGGLSGPMLPQQWPGRQQVSQRPALPPHMQSSPAMHQGLAPYQSGFGNLQGMQSMPNLNMMGMPQHQQYPYHNQNMAMSNMSLGMNHMGMGPNYNPMMMPGQMQPPMGTNMHAHMGGMGMPMGYGMQNMNMATYDAIGMGPPLSTQQRSTIDQWRQSVA